MNFRYMPELQERGAYFVVWVVMIGIALAMLVWFVRAGWISRRK
jgi:magnesium transporter